MGSDTNDIIDRLFDKLLQRPQQAIETSNERGSGFTHETLALLYYYFQKVEIKKAESYIKSPDWLAHKKATANPKNENDDKCFQYAIINYNKIKKKYLKNIEKIKQADIGFSSHQRDWENFAQNNTSIALNVIFVSYNSEEIKRAYKSR